MSWVRIAFAACGLVLASCGSPIVSGECKQGFTLCGGACVSLQSDSDHCGACEQSCDGFVCEDAECTSTPLPDDDGGAGSDAGDDGGAGSSGSGGGRPDAGSGNVPIGSPFDPDGGLTFPDPDVDDSCGLGQLRCAGQCVNPNTSSAHCGGCGMACDVDQLCALGECVDRCEDPLELCDDACVDYQNDPQNCGDCGNECASGICTLGECADTVVGHVVVIGHDFTQAVLTMQRIAGSALFIARGSPVRAAVYAGVATNASRNGVTAAIDEVIALEGRSWQQIDVDADTLTAELLGVQAVIIHAQANESNDRLRELGTVWGKALAQFVARGGVIILFEAPSENAGTFQILEPSGLFEASSRESIANGLTLNVAQEQIGLGAAKYATRSYLSRRSSVRFEGVTTPAAVVVTDPDGNPVVLHRRVAP